MSEHKELLLSFVCFIGSSLAEEVAVYFAGSSLRASSHADYTA